MCNAPARRGAIPCPEAGLAQVTPPAVPFRALSHENATEAVARYKSLADIERGFRVLKSDIEIAPVHHRLPERIRAHAMICFLALVLYRVMRMRLEAKGHSASPRAALDLLARIQKHTAHTGERTFKGISRTQPEQLDLFDALSLPKPAQAPALWQSSQLEAEDINRLAP